MGIVVLNGQRFHGIATLSSEIFCSWCGINVRVRSLVHRPLICSSNTQPSGVIIPGPLHYLSSSANTFVWNWMARSFYCGGDHWAALGIRSTLSIYNLWPNTFTIQTSCSGEQWAGLISASGDKFLQFIELHIHVEHVTCNFA